MQGDQNGAVATAMETGHRRGRLLRRVIVLAAAALAATLGVRALLGGHRSPPVNAQRAFAWLRPAPAPTGWHVGATRSGARLAYPASWRPVQTDRGTVSAAPAGPGGTFVGYLNATPVGGGETLSNWSRFRVAHLAEEGDHRVRLEAAATGLRFRAGHGSCVIDSYSTSRARFREIACIVAGARATTVVIAAAPASGFSQQAAVLKRAVSSFTT
jgi:hypothetical protein